MKFKNTVLPIICGGLLAASFMFSAFASTVVPGSADDPVVTKSYVDKLVSETAQGLRNSINYSSSSNSSNSQSAEISEYQMEFIIEEVKAQVLKSTAATQNQTQTQTPKPAETVEIPVYTPVSLIAGEILIGAEGTEIILRSGTAKGYTMVADGLANVTTGQDIGNNVDIGRNNLLIVPRGDGRGVKASTDVWLLVKGTYYISR